MTEFTPWQSALGGALIGLAAVLLMALHGRIAGMTGIVSGLLGPASGPEAGGRGWRLAFLAGAAVAPLLLAAVAGMAIPFASPSPPIWTAIGGFAVGLGAGIGGGCTSGHGVCGMARLSRRSVVATLTFMLATGVTVHVVRHVIGGF